jgi:hypothetical protein
MPELFDVAVSTLDSETVTIHEAFGGQTRLSNRAVHAARNDPAWLQKVAMAEALILDIRTARRPLHHFSEAMSTSDFPLLFADSLDRQLYGAYMATEPTWANYARSATVNDFRAVKRFATSGVRGILNEVGELAEFERRGQTEAEYTYAVKKYEAGFAVSFEAMINDDLDAFMRLPQDLADSARDTEERFATTLFVDANGPHATHYTVGNNNLGTGILTRENLQAAITVLMKRTDDNGNPIQVTSIELVVGPGLALEAREIIEATEYRSVDANGNVTIIKGNGVAANLRVNVNFWIPSVASTANADTSWWLFASPTGPRPALEIGRLRGYEQPALYEKVPNMRRISGGAEEPFSFETEAQEKKVRHILGGSFVDTRMTWASTGTTS